MKKNTFFNNLHRSCATHNVLKTNSSHIYLLFSILPTLTNHSCSSNNFVTKQQDDKQIMIVMTVSNTSAKKQKSNVKLELAGSQINLSPRPVTATHLAWSSNYQTYPMRRSVSAFGFQSKAEENSDITSRPLSADNIKYANKNNFPADFCDDDINIQISKSNQNVKTCEISENEFENIINEYSEIKAISETENRPESSLKPGLLSKPPLPFCVEQKSIKTEVDNSSQQFNKTALKNTAEQEAFDEIIALKFQRWFPNTMTNIPKGSNSDDEIDNLELLSYREHKFQTCEYRYEVLTKNNKTAYNKAYNKHNNQTGFKNNKLKTKKSGIKVKSKVFRRHSSTIDYTDETLSPSISNSLDLNSDNDRTESEFVMGCECKDTKLETVPSEPNNNEKPEVILGDTDPLQLLAAQDLRMMQAKKNAKSTNPQTNGTIGKYSSSKLKKESISSKPKDVKNNFSKTKNSLSSHASPYKKQKKISFSVDRQYSGGIKTKSTDLENSSSSTIDTIIKDKPDFEKSEKYVEHPRDSRNDVLREMTTSPQQPAGSQIEDVLSWMGFYRSATPHSKLATPENERSCSMYEEIVDILKDIEKEEINNGNSPKNDASHRYPAPSTSAKAIWTLLEEAEKNNNTDIDDAPHSTRENIISPDITPLNRSVNAEETKNRTRLSDLLRYPNTELAQKVMALQLLLDERESTLQNLSARYKTNEQLFQQQKQELEHSLNKQQRLIEQIKLEKKTSVEKLENMIKEIERKHVLALQAQEEKFKIEFKKSLDKQAISDKLEREKWMETKTQKIKELAIKGLEPELNRMATAHQEEIAEIRKFHKRQLEELDEAWNRRMSVQKEKMEADKEKALAIEREMSRQKLDDEIGELEKRYQEQRKRLLAEVHVERENIERTSEATLAIKEKENERKWEMKSIEMQKKIEALQLEHQEEIQKLHQNLETEKQIWIKNQTMEQLEKENKLKEQCKKERDKHIDLIIQKLENENIEREQVAEQKMKRLKEQYETEINDLEVTNENLRRKLNDSRSEIQKNEETISQLRTQLNQSHSEIIILKEKYDRLMTEHSEMQNMVKSEMSTKIHILQSELNQAQMTYESQIKSLKSENERELSQMYNRVKEMIMKKDDSINLLKKQKDAALDQCNQLEKLLDMKRKDTSIYR